MVSKQIRNLLFDFGNVIIDIDVEGAIERLTQLGRPDGDRSAVQRILIEYECGRVSTDIFINTILREARPDVQAIDVIDAWNSMLLGIPGYRLVMLQQIRTQYGLYMLSNTNELHLEWVYRHLKSRHGVKEFEKEFFDGVYYSHIVGDRKPLPSIFKHVIEDAYLTPEMTLFLDDVAENIQTAQQLGFHTYQVRPDQDIAEYLKIEGYY